MLLVDSECTSVDLCVGGGDEVEVERFGDQFSAGLSHASSACGVGQQVEDGVGQCLGISSGDQHPIFSVPDHFFAAGHVGGDQRQTECSGLEQHPWHTLSQVTGQDEHVAECEDGRHIGSPTQEPDIRTCVDACGRERRRPLVHFRSDQQEGDLRVAGSDPCRGLEVFGNPLGSDQSRDHRDHGPIGQFEFVTKSGTSRRASG